MNFLSHYYFDRYTGDCYFTLGTVLPDLLKNADKTIILHPEKLVNEQPGVNSIIQGWNKHLLVDRYFHSSDFFQHHSHAIKNALAPVIAGSPVKPFFLGHIAIELILDNLLLTTNKVSVSDFYRHLNNCSGEVISNFLAVAGLKDKATFFNFYTRFKKSEYLKSYQDISQVTYALKRICMRVWNDPFTPQQEAKMTEVILAYRDSILSTFMLIYEDIDGKLI